jgi:hypothetical protein
MRRFASSMEGSLNSSEESAQWGPVTARYPAPVSLPSKVPVLRAAAGIEKLDDDINHQLSLMGSRCPPYRRMLELLQQLLGEPEGKRIAQALAASWERRIFEGVYERPLLLLAALRYDALVEGSTHPLFEGFAAERPNAGAVTKERLATAMGADRMGFWITLRTRRVQTNEVSRSLTWLWPAMLAGCNDRRRPLAIVDVGASAGLNLIGDRLRLSWQRRGSSTPIQTPVALDVRSRVGFDPRPLDVRKKENCEWLRASIWPGESARLARLDAALATFEQVVPPPDLQLARASSVPGFLDAATRNAGAGGLVIVYQTLVQGYIRAAEREPYTSGMMAWLAAGNAGERAWATLEVEDVTDPSFGCMIEVHVSTGKAPETVRLARAGYHPEAADPLPGAEQRLQTLLSTRAS